MAPGQRIRGATLLEILVAIGLIAVVAAIVWQAGSLTARLRVRAAATALVSDLRAAQALAMAERRPRRAHGLQFEPGSDRYFIVVRDESTTTQSRLRRLPDGVRVTYARFGGAVPTAALFNGVSLFGAPSGGGTVTLANGQARWCVRLLPATGRIRVAAVGCP
ncbi:MAG: hypothetical protein AUI83_12205 [Armatimonadetes bacterium 13_1_40CM_3_65_7]|nr:MAG: hypothetical protein AUI83_12205 [Armatimonadetes bacterium 13_1_40CM_3_65_7]